MFWVNTLPGRRCLLASKPEDLRDGEVICELAAMLLGPQCVPQPGDRLGTGVDKEYADAEKLELALEALAKHADMPLGNRDHSALRGAGTNDGGSTPGSSQAHAAGQSRDARRRERRRGEDREGRPTGHGADHVLHA